MDSWIVGPRASHGHGSVRERLEESQMLTVPKRLLVLVESLQRHRNHRHPLKVLVETHTIWYTKSRHRNRAECGPKFKKPLWGCISTECYPKPTGIIKILIYIDG
jgi:hypothetical protein